MPEGGCGWRMKGEGVRMGNPNKLDLWTDLRVRMHKLGRFITKKDKL